MEHCYLSHDYAMLLCPGTLVTISSSLRHANPHVLIDSLRGIVTGYTTDAYMVRPDGCLLDIPVCYHNIRPFYGDPPILPFPPIKQKEEMPERALALED